jgi:hypothetical protein
LVWTDLLSYTRNRPSSYIFNTQKLCVVVKLNYNSIIDFLREYCFPTLWGNDTDFKLLKTFQLNLHACQKIWPLQKLKYYGAGGKTVLNKVLEKYLINHYITIEFFIFVLVTSNGPWLCLGKVKRYECSILTIKGLN